MLNKIIIMGRLVRDPELRRTQSGTAVTSFRLAVDRDYKAEDGSKQADFFDVVAWRSPAEFVSKYFSKGRMAVVEGRLQSRPWTDKDGNKRVAIEIVAESVYFGDSRRSELDTAGGPPPGWDQEPQELPDEEKGELPF
ncbi:MAG: single-stranded DNA-binding protein [Dysosmobacter sp.]|nr:single-stranded DNA-binding protein [Dysosmobacter sp.]